MLILLFSTLISAEQRTVLVEVFASTTCQYCADAIRGVEELKINHGDTVSVLVYYPNITDPFYAPESYQRGLYYSISGVPVAVFDGIKRVEGGSSDHTSMYRVYKDTFDVRKVVDQPVGFDVSGEYDYQLRKGTLFVKLKNQHSYALSGHLRTAEVIVDTNYLWQDMDHLVYVVRKMFPDYKGILVDVAPFDSVSLSVEFSIGEQDAEDKIAFIIFLQMDESKEVVGSMPEVSLASLNWVGVSDVAKKGMKVLCGKRVVRFLIESDAVVNLSIFDVQGRELVRRQMIRGELHLSLKQGVYFYRMGNNYGMFVVY